MAVYPGLRGPQVPEFSLAGLPGLVPTFEAAQALKTSDIFAMLQSIAEEHGIRLLAMLWNPGGFLAKGREIIGPTSVASLKMRVSDPLFWLMMEKAGASVTTMPSNEIYAAMKSGSLDAVVTTYETILSRKIYEQAKFATVGGPSLFMGFSPLVMSLSTWKGLSKEQQVAVEEAAAITDTFYESAQRDVERRMVATLREAGVTVRRMSDDIELAAACPAHRVARIHPHQSSGAGAARQAGAHDPRGRRGVEIGLAPVSSRARPRAALWAGVPGTTSRTAGTRPRARPRRPQGP
jgi:TRAP-type C4-dicarboxylate transport system substrate-binding protein